MFDWASLMKRPGNGADRHAQNGLFGARIQKVRIFASATPVLCAKRFCQHHPKGGAGLAR